MTIIENAYSCIYYDWLVELLDASKKQHHIIYLHFLLSHNIQFKTFKKIQHGVH